MTTQEEGRGSARHPRWTRSSAFAVHHRAQGLPSPTQRSTRAAHAALSSLRCVAGCRRLCTRAAESGMNGLGRLLVDFDSLSDQLHASLFLFLVR